jgi:hypothetical protein
MGLKRFVKKARKALHLPALTLGNVAKVGLAASTGGVGALGAMALASKLKTAGVGGIKQIVRAKAQKALNDRTATLLPKRDAGNTAAQATTMPGGAAIGRAVVRAARRTVKRRVKVARRSSGGSSSSSGKRAAPKGGLDLKAASASWKAAGKPGKWLDWVKSHR